MDYFVTKLDNKALFILQLQSNCAKRIQYTLTLPDNVLIPIFPTHNKEAIRKMRNFQIAYFIPAEFLCKVKNEMRPPLKHGKPFTDD